MALLNYTLTIVRKLNNLTVELVIVPYLISLLFLNTALYCNNLGKRQSSVEKFVSQDR